ncbi:TcaA 3rd/4th domain-containing protein [Jeotgalibacillus campisalis]|uniref:DNA-dirted RNA polymerase n=1 Tax=Jeotgalibacillus campisalis TaxID=220754 RepID=A0A0C2VGJ8_9BACL|nr:zinc ribbon domain-containing protein [Jeotgalibacillus campisalis]KIL43118.1 DNA-dirted RNA polymerase [Jeotgalibacillus campisalis]
MTRFCKECGAPVSENHSVCTECGHRLPQVEKMEMTEPKPKPPKTKKQKAIVAAGMTAAIVLIGGSFFASKQVSAENTMKKFAEAINQQNADALTSLVVHEDGSTIKKFEAEAMLNFSEEELQAIKESVATTGETPYFADTLYSIEQNGKWLGLFNRYSVKAADQYSELFIPEEEGEIELQLNGTPVSSDAVDTGPYAPGIYTLSSAFENEYGTVTSQQDLTFAGTSGSLHSNTVELDFDYVSFYLDQNTDYETSVILNDTKIPFDSWGVTENIGPLPTDGSITVSIEAEYPWETVKVDKIAVESSNQEVTLPLFTKETEEKFTKVIAAYGEEWVKARAKGDASLFTTATEEWMEETHYMIDDVLSMEIVYSGQLDEVQLQPSQAAITRWENADHLTVPVSFTTTDSYHLESEKATLAQQSVVCNMVLVYSEKEDQFKVDECHTMNHTDSFSGEVTKEGSAELHKGTGVKQNANDNMDGEYEFSEDDSESKERLETFMIEYNDASISAINNVDFSYVSSMLVDGSPRVQEQSDFIDHLGSIGVTEEHVSTTLDKMEVISSTEALAHTTETFVIYNDLGKHTKSYSTITEVHVVDGEIKIYELISTDEID